MEPLQMIGLATSGGDSNFLSAWVKACKDGQVELDEWRAMLIKAGVKAAHPNDGWVDREKNEVHLAYPRFDHNPQIDDVIVLGNPKQWRAVVVTNIRQSPMGLKWYKFKRTDRGQG